MLVNVYWRSFCLPFMVTNFRITILHLNNLHPTTLYPTNLNPTTLHWRRPRGATAKTILSCCGSRTVSLSTRRASSSRWRMTALLTSCFYGLVGLASHCCTLRCRYVCKTSSRYSRFVERRFSCSSSVCQRPLSEADAASKTAIFGACLLLLLLSFRFRIVVTSLSPH